MKNLLNPKKNKYEGLRKECDEFKAKLRVIGDERRATEAKAAAASKPRMLKRKSRPDLFTSTFSGLLKEWFTYHWYNIKTCAKHIKHEIIPTIFCLRAEANIPYNE